MALIRIEYILIVSLAVLFGFIFMKQPNDVKAIESNLSKELYFKNLSLIDLNQNGVENRLLASSISKYKDFFEFEKIDATYKKNHKLLANRATYRDGFVHIENNISLKRSDGLSFIANNLEYNMETKSLYAKSDFQLDINGSRVLGKNLYYNLDIKEVKADFIRAKIEF